MTPTEACRAAYQGVRSRWNWSAIGQWAAVLVMGAVAIYGSWGDKLDAAEAAGRKAGEVRQILQEHGEEIDTLKRQDSRRLDLLRSIDQRLSRIEGRLHQPDQ